MVKVVERDFDGVETPNERKNKLYRALQSSLGDVDDILVLNLENVVSIDHGNIELSPYGVIAVYPIDSTEQYRVQDAHKHYPHLQLAGKVASVYESETGEEAIIFKFRRRIR
ncbi:hypothetical protein HY500_00025 [Candidatus Woesearchaeota archaeon]|nr:hypothetical protein [Candidatus Woesearchaeota archaeon]